MNGGLLSRIARLTRLNFGYLHYIQFESIKLSVDVESDRRSHIDCLSKSLPLRLSLSFSVSLSPPLSLSLFSSIRHPPIPASEIDVHPLRDHKTSKAFPHSIWADPKRQIVCSAGHKTAMERRRRVKLRRRREDAPTTIAREARSWRML